MSNRANSPVSIDASKIYSQETAGDKLTRKVKEDPFVPIGIAGFVVALGYGAYAYKFRAGMSTSIYLMRLRVIAQTSVVGAMIFGVGYSLVRNSFKKEK